MQEYFEPLDTNIRSKSIDFSIKESFSGIGIYTDIAKFPDYKSAEIAIIGITENRGTECDSSEFAPNKIRSELFKLSLPSTKSKIVDMGNIHKGNTLKDSYIAIKDVLVERFSNGTNAIILGAGQDLVYGVFLAFAETEHLMHLVNIDSRLDVNPEPALMPARKFVSQILMEDSPYLVNYSAIGYQSHYTAHSELRLMQNLEFDAYRIGQVRADIAEMEPVLRDATVICLDTSSIRSSDSPGHFNPSVNGFYGEEICQLAKYAGIGEYSKVFGVFEYCPEFDNRNQTAAMLAQSVWYYIDGFYQRKYEDPSKNEDDFQKYIVHNEELNNPLIFYKSLISGRWWLELPQINIKKDDKIIISCSYSDYKKAANNEISDYWWKYLKKIRY